MEFGKLGRPLPDGVVEPAINERRDIDARRSDHRPTREDTQSLSGFRLNRFGRRPDHRGWGGGLGPQCRRREKQAQRQRKQRAGRYAKRSHGQHSHQ